MAVNQRANSQQLHLCSSTAQRRRASRWTVAGRCPCSQGVVQCRLSGSLSSSGHPDNSRGGSGAQAAQQQVRQQEVTGIVGPNRVLHGGRDQGFRSDFGPRKILASAASSPGRVQSGWRPCLCSALCQCGVRAWAAAGGRAIRQGGWLQEGAASRRIVLPAARAMRQGGWLPEGAASRRRAQGRAPARPCVLLQHPAPTCLRPPLCL